MTRSSTSQANADLQGRCCRHRADGLAPGQPLEIVPTVSTSNKGHAVTDHVHGVFYAGAGSLKPVVKTGQKTLAMLACPAGVGQMWITITAAHVKGKA